MASTTTCVQTSSDLEATRVGIATVYRHWAKLRLNRVVYFLILMLFKIPHNDITNAFKACLFLDGQPRHLAQPSHRRVPKLKLTEMGSRYFFVAYIWLEKYFSRGDYRKSPASPAGTDVTGRGQPQSN